MFYLLSFEKCSKIFCARCLFRKLKCICDLFLNIYIFSANKWTSNKNVDEHQL